MKRDNRSGARGSLNRGPAIPEPAFAGFFFLEEIELNILWAFAQRKRHCPHFEDTELGFRIARTMRGRFPFPGHQWDKFLTVYLKPGQHIALHHHRRHAVLFYPQQATVIIDGKQRTLVDGEMIYIPPMTPHEVPRVTLERLSLAMIVSEPATTRLTTA